jgi:Mg2+ and Co2+ transporter CorA
VTDLATPAHALAVPKRDSDPPRTIYLGPDGTTRRDRSSTLDSYLTQVSNRLGQATKGLSLVATVTLPFVIISGMWGMNFDSIPLSHHPSGFWLLLGFQVAVGLVLLALLRVTKLL